jgi:hypothetical protein
MSVGDFSRTIVRSMYLIHKGKAHEHQQNEAENHRLERYQKQTVLNKGMLQHRSE